MNPEYLNVVLIIGAIVIAIIVIASIILITSNLRIKYKSRRSLPKYGSDSSDFAKRLSQRYQNEDK